MKTIFLSASIPVSERDTKYMENSDIVAIRDAVLALVYFCMFNEIRIVWGGHPAITPLINEAIRQITNNIDCINFSKEDSHNIQKFVHIYQSLYFKDKYPKDNEQFKNITFVESGSDLSSSLSLMREKMLSEEKYIAGVFIGGMDGVEDEYNLFREKHSSVPTFPVASTGAASYIIYSSAKQDYSSELLNNYAYRALFEKMLGDLIR